MLILLLITVAGSIPGASTMYAVVSGCKKLLEMPSRNGFGVFTRCTGLQAAACCGAPYKSILSATAANGACVRVGCAIAAPGNGYVQAWR